MSVEPASGSTTPALEAFIRSIATTVEHDEVNQAFRHIVESVVLRDAHVTTPDAPTERFRERMLDSVEHVIPAVSRLVDAMAKGSPTLQREMDTDPAVRRTCLLEIVRYAYREELLRACALPDAFWTIKRNDVAQCAARYGVSLEKPEWERFRSEVDGRAEKIRRHREVLSAMTPEQRKVRSVEKERKKHSPQAKRKTLYSGYVKAAAVSRLDDPPHFAEYAFASYAYLAIASIRLDPWKLLKLEDEVVGALGLVKAAMLMPKSMFDRFADQMKNASERLMDSAGTIVVHHDDGVKHTDIDAAVQSFLRDNQDSFESRIQKWIPERLEQRRASPADIRAATEGSGQQK